MFCRGCRGVSCRPWRCSHSRNGACEVSSSGGCWWDVAAVSNQVKSVPVVQANGDAVHDMET